MLQRDGIARADDTTSIPGRPHFTPRAKNVIWLFMLGGTSHLESFDPKPALNRYAGLTINESPYAKAVLAMRIPEARQIETLVLSRIRGGT